MKNHRIKSLKDAKGIILLIRNPYDAILAEFNRVSSKKDANGSKKRLKFVKFLNQFLEIIHDFSTFIFFKPDCSYFILFLFTNLNF